MTGPLLEIEDLVVEYPVKGRRAAPFRVLKEVSLDIRAGECVGLVGESGSGKTTLGRAVLGLAPVTGGSVRYEGREISRLSRKERRALSSDIQVVFQDPYTSLNPAMTIEQILAEPLTVRDVDRAEAGRRVRALLDQVHLPADAGRRLRRERKRGSLRLAAPARQGGSFVRRGRFRRRNGCGVRAGLGLRLAGHGRLSSVRDGPTR